MNENYIVCCVCSTWKIQTVTEKKKLNNVHDLEDNIIKMSFLPKFIYIFSTIPGNFFVDTEKTDSKIPIKIPAGFVM